MNPLFISIGAAVLLLAALFVVIIKTNPRAAQWFANTVTITAINLTFPKGRGTRLADASFTSRYLLCKAGSDTSHIAICTAADQPLGVVPDMTPTVDQANSDLSYPLPVNVLGLNEDSERMVASAAIAVDALVVPAAAGQVKTLPTAGGGTTFVVGKAVTAALAAGDLIEVIPCFPIPTTIAA